MSDNIAYNVPALLHALRTKNVSAEQQLEASASAYPPAGVIPNTGVSRMAMVGIHAPHPHDVLAGRGKSINHHPGNQYFISLIKPLKTDYVATPKQEKSMFARMVIQKVKNLNPPGRFLKQDPRTGLWYDIGEKKAILKTRQALREGAPEIEKLLKNGEVTAKMKHSLDPSSVKRALDKISKPAEISEWEPSVKRQKSSESSVTRGHTVDSIAFDRKYSSDPPDDAAELLISFAADSSNAVAARNARQRNDAFVNKQTIADGDKVAPASGTKENKAHATVDEAMVLVGASNGDRKQTPMPPLGGSKEIENSVNRRVSFKAPQASYSNGKNSTLTSSHVTQSVSPNRRVSYRAQENLTEGGARQVKVGRMSADGSTNRRVSYKVNEELDQAGSKRTKFINGAEIESSKSDNRRISFVANGGTAGHSLVPQHSEENGDPNRRASFMGQQDLDAIRRASAASQDIVMMSQRYQNDLASAGLNHAGLAAAQKLGMVMAPQGFQDGNDIGYPNRRVSFMSAHDLDFARRSSLASLNDALIKQNILGYSEAGAGLPFLSQQIDDRRGSLLAHEILLQNQLLGGADGNGRRDSITLQNGMAMMQQQGNQNIPGMTKESLQNRRVSFQSQHNLIPHQQADTKAKSGGDVVLPPKREGQEALIEGSVMIPGVGNRRVSMTAEQFNALQAAQGNPGIVEDIKNGTKDDLGHEQSKQSSKQKTFASL